MKIYFVNTIIKENVMNDISFLKKAFLLAKKARGKTSPNPMVGCVITKDGKIVGEGYHKKAGLPHAEIEALDKAGDNAKDATLYVNLEPCSHYGRTPPCTDRIISSHIKRVVFSNIDPNPMVNGKEILEKSGIKVDIGLLKEEGERLNEVYFKYIKEKMPFVILKVGLSLDGRITSGKRWITNEKSRKIVHRIRSYVDAIMVGKGTIIKDDPYLTTRLVKGKSPKRIVVTTDGNIPLNSHVFGMKEDLIIVSTIPPPKEIEKKANVVIAESEDGLVSPRDMLSKCAKLGISSILLEGGRALITSFISKSLVDKVILFIAPKLIGERGMPMLGDIEPLRLKDIKIRRIGDDIMLTGYL